MPETTAANKSVPAGLRWFVRFSQLVWWLAVGAWLFLLGATFALHVLIVPRIMDWRPQIEAMASQAWGVQVSIGELDAVSDGWVPSFTLRDFVLRNAKGQQVLHLPVVRASLTPASLLRLSLDRIELDGPELEVLRSADNRWWVAGLLIEGSDTTALADWLFTQPRLLVQHGRLHWVDEFHQQAPVTFSDVRLAMRNGLRSHDLRLDVTPPPGWGDRFLVQGQFSQPLFNRHASDVATWRGRAFAELPQVDLAKLSPLLHEAGVLIHRGAGWVRIWADVDQGQWQQPTLDMALTDLQVQWADQPMPLSVRHLAGRVHWQPWAQGLGHALQTEEVKVTLEDGEAWHSHRMHVAWRNEGEVLAKAGELQIESVSIAMLARVLERLPIDANVRQALGQAKPQGQLQQLDLHWSDLQSPAFQFNAKGQLADLTLQSSAPHSPPTAWWWPGAQAAQVQFQINEHAGLAQVLIQNGSMTLVDWLEEPRVPLQQLQGELSWALEDKHWRLQIKQGKLSNEVAQGDFDLTWKEGATLASLGDLDLQIKAQRFDARALHRYLPQEMDAQARHYLRDAIIAGQFVNAKMTLQGSLDLFPFNKAHEGVFKVNAPFEQAVFQYAPMPPGNAQTKKAAWPALQQFFGEVQINRNRLQIKSGAARMGQGGVLQVPKLDVQINDLNDIVVEVTAQIKGNLSDALQAVNASPLADTVGSFLGPVKATGTAEHQVHFILPAEKPELTRIQGSLQLNGNDLQWLPQLPRFYKTRGTVNYSESGLNVNAIRARVLGSEARLDGALRFVDSATEGPVRLSLQGAVSAEALRQSPELSALSSLTAKLNGSTQYIATLGLRDGEAVYTLTSNMQGMGIDLPAPLDKPKDAIWPLRVDSDWVRNPGKGPAYWEQISAQLGSALALNYLRDTSTASPTVLRGRIQAGQAVNNKEPTENGVSMQVRQPYLNVDDWLQALSAWTDGNEPRQATQAKPVWQAYLPQKVDLQSAEVVWLGRSFRQLQASAERQSKVWLIQTKATELQGSAEYRPPQDAAGARLVARLSHLQIPPAVLEEVESAMSDSPQDMPALDIVVDNLELRGIAMGRAEIDGFARTGVSGSREWVLNKLNLTMPEANFQSKGQWGGPGKAAAKLSQLDFTLNIQDSGLLLERFGYPGAIRNGKGRMVGQVGWQGSPFSPDYNSMSGQFNVNIERGQFLKADPGVSRLLGVLSLQSLPRRLKFDFSDVFSEGFAFDFVRGDIFIQRGIASTNNLQMKGVSAAVLMEGHADIQRETQDIKVLMVPELNAGTASLFYSTINPVVGITSFLAQYFLRKPLIKSATQELRVQGSWKDPKVTKIDTPAPNAAPAKP